MPRKGKAPGKFDPDNWTCLGGKRHCPGTTKVTGKDGVSRCDVCGRPT